MVERKLEALLNTMVPSKYSYARTMQALNLLPGFAVYVIFSIAPVSYKAGQPFKASSPKIVCFVM